MTTLIKTLREQTTSLKVQYVQMTKEWAERHFDTITIRDNWKEADWCKFLGLETVTANPGTSSAFETFPQGFFNTKAARTYVTLKNELNKYLRIGKSNFVSKKVAAAERHYEDSILKLAYRIEKKGLNQSNLEILTSHIGVNIETTFSDGIKKVRAFTIIASGPIQRPHYRYLIK